MNTTGYKRVLYKKNPLANVVCQLRFPPILLLDGSPPREFQDKIRNLFPGYNERIEIQQEIRSTINVKNIEQIANPMSTVISNKNYAFISEDNAWQVNLTRNFISLTTSKYNRWEDFFCKFKEPLDSFLKIYSPAFFTRIGLRYINIFDRSELNLKNTSWDKLIKLSMPDALYSSEDDVLDFNSVTEIKLDNDNNRAIIKIILLRDRQSNEICLSLDNDLYTLNKTLPNDIEGILSRLHSYSTKILRACESQVLKIKR
jgi:uncharacterized protein (TIGR04255 family)